MSKNDEQNEEIRCSFCGKSRDEVNKLIAGQGVYICDECVKICDEILAESAVMTHADFSQENILKPADIKSVLDEYVIGQDEAKKALSVAVYNHYKRINHIDDAASDNDVELQKTNICLIGPTGSGKTLLAQTLARVLNVPFAIADATSLTEAGYVGEDVENILLKLIQAADFDMDAASRGIIYIDEIDKIARKSGANNSITADPGHEGVQQALLKMLEGNVVEFTARGQRKHPEAPTIKVDTKNILFIVGGAFVGIDDVIAKRLQKADSSIGFGAEVTSKSEKPTFDELIHQVRPEDLMQYGIIPEIIGRLPIICTLETLDEDALLRILTEPKNAPVKQYEKLLAMDNVKLEFAEDALRAVAKKAIERKTGARSLKGIIEDVMHDDMNDIPKTKEPRKVIITKACNNEAEKPEVIALDK